VSASRARRLTKRRQMTRRDQDAAASGLNIGESEGEEMKKLRLSEADGVWRVVGYFVR
jgi:hypothetical protein